MLIFSMQIAMEGKAKIMTAKRVLVIDDEDDIREVAQLCLEMVGGWEVTTAASGIS